MRAADLHRVARAVREIALQATATTGQDAVSAGVLAVVEDVAVHPGSTVGQVSARAHLAQSLVSRIARELGDAGVLTVEPDATDRRRTLLTVSPAALPGMQERGDNDIRAALAACTPGLDDAERTTLESHLAAAADLLSRARTPEHQEAQQATVNRER